MIKRISYCLLLAALLSSCENDIGAVMAFDAKKAAVENGTDIVTIFSQGGRVSAKLTAPVMERSLERPSYVEFKQGLKVLMYDSLLNLTSTLTAKHGKYMEEEGFVYLRDSVELITVKGEKLESNELNYDPHRKIFYSTKEVFITTPTSQLHGWGLEANEDFSVKKILSVSGPITLEDSTSMSEDSTVNAVPSSATPAAPAPATTTVAPAAPTSPIPTGVQAGGNAPVLAPNVTRPRPALLKVKKDTTLH
ncbi:LPS export ABC transporter periplasmic protein LptC [Chitinophaga jiangningensis]|uniref:LPS export ABC transporter periplasmic protein LptC n=1 Tax=Chitinophaga jiangningensis TaxID=1419482 RepID=UPI0009F90A57|nr:LPS export ABC transporter periplasmic protein LptC [Chitinophaga jiangningensis]